MATPLMSCYHLLINSKLYQLQFIVLGFLIEARLVCPLNVKFQSTQIVRDPQQVLNRQINKLIISTWLSHCFRHPKSSIFLIFSLYFLSVCLSLFTLTHFISLCVSFIWGWGGLHTVVYEGYSQFHSQGTMKCQVFNLGFLYPQFALHLPSYIFGPKRYCSLASLPLFYPTLPFITLFFSFANKVILL